MTHLLFIDACPRGAGVSRSLALGEAFMPLMDKIAPMIGPATDAIANGSTGIVNAIMAVTDWMDRW